MLRITVLSVKSRCKREMGNLADKKLKKALAISKFPSAFSKSIGLTLWAWSMNQLHLL